MKVSKRNEEPIIEGSLPGKIVPHDSRWYLDDGHIVISLVKSVESVKWWPSVVVGEPEIDVELIEASKYLDDSLIKRIKREKAEKAAAEAANDA